MATTKETSEFGSGCLYNLGLFIAHYWQYHNMKHNDYYKDRIQDLNELWFNGASDHFYDLQIPSTIPKHLQIRLWCLREFGLNIGHGMYKYRADYTGWLQADDPALISDCLEEAVELLRLLDIVSTIKGTWE